MRMRKQSGPGSSAAAGRRDRTVVAGTVAMVLALACCAAGPALLALLGGLALGSVLGLATGVIAVAAAIGLLVVRIRRRRGGPAPATAKRVLR